MSRSQSNHLAGWFVGVGLLIANVALDPLHLYSTFSDSPATEAWYVGLPWYAWFAVLGIGAFATFGRPRVEVGAVEVVLCNAVRDVHIPLGLVEDADWGTRYLVVTAGGKRHRAIGAETTPMPLFGGVAADAARVISQAAEGKPAVGSVRVLWRRPELVELVLASLWLLYPVAAMVADHLGLQPS